MFTVRGGLRKQRHLLGLLGVVAVLAGCGNATTTSVAPIPGGPGTVTPSPTPSKSASPTPTPSPSGTSPTPTPTPTTHPSSSPTASPTPVSTPACTSATAIPVTGGTATASATTGTISLTFPAGAFTSTTDVGFCYVTQAKLPTPLARARLAGAAGPRRPAFTPGSGNTYVAAFTTSFGGATLNGSAALSGSAGVVPSSIAVGSELSIAVYGNGTYTDVGTATVGTGGTFMSSIPTPSEPGVDAAGVYLVYLPTGGTTVPPVNLGFAMIADDGTGFNANGLQFVQVENSQGVAEPVPTTTFFPIPNVEDIDAQALTPSAERGGLVDGGGNLYFYSGIPQHTFTLAPNPLDVSSFGSDGDSIALLPRGDEAIAALDDGAPLIDVSGISSGNPVVANTIAPGPDMPGATAVGFRDGLVISNDGKTMLVRSEFSGALDIFSIAGVAAHPGSTGKGTTSYAFTLSTTLFDLPMPFVECGREAMAISPVDSSRALVAGQSTSDSAPAIALLTGLPGVPTVSTFHVHVPPVTHRKPVRHDREPSPHRRPYALIPPADGSLYAVAIAPNGNTAYVSTDAGIVTLSGVASGNLTQSGSVYSPNLPLPAGQTTASCPLVSAYTISVLPDGKYLVADVDCGLTPVGNPPPDNAQSIGVLVTIPIGANGALGAPVGQLNYVVDPSSDQLIAH